MAAPDALADLMLAISRAVFVTSRRRRAPFSVFPKADIDPALVTPELLSLLASACRAAGAVVEVNERWRTPSPGVVRTLSSLGVELVPSSDAHDATALGRWDHVAAAAGLVRA